MKTISNESNEVTPPSAFPRGTTVVAMAGPTKGRRGVVLRAGRTPGRFIVEYEDAIQVVENGRYLKRLA